MAVKFPDFIIPGAQKSGTSSLYNYIKDHPQCLMSIPKETHFFCKEENMNKLEDYMVNFTRNKKFGGKKVKVMGEASASYMFDKKTIKRIGNAFPKKTKFIFLLRNPTQRAISSYWHMRKREADMRSIEGALLLGTDDPGEAMKKEASNIKESIKEGVITERFNDYYDAPINHFYYVRNSVYTMFIREFLKYFPKKNMLFLFTDDLRKNPEKTVKQAEEFLGISKDYMPKNLNESYNKTYIPVNTGFAGAVNKIKNFIQKFYNPQSRTLLKIYRKIATKEKPETDKKIVDYLDKVFKKEIKDLEKLTGKKVPEKWK